MSVLRRPEPVADRGRIDHPDDTSKEVPEACSCITDTSSAHVHENRSVIGVFSVTENVCMVGLRWELVSL